MFFCTEQIYSDPVFQRTDPSHQGLHSSSTIWLDEVDSSDWFRYITYSKEEEAVRCIQSVYGYTLEGRPLRACFGTTKYSHACLRSVANNTGTMSSKMKKKAKLQRVIRSMKKQQLQSSEKTTSSRSYSPLNHLNDAQGFVEKLYSRLQTADKFEIKGKPDSAETVVLVDGYLTKRACCWFSRLDMQNLPGVDALTAFAYFFDAESTRKYVSSRSLAEERQISSLLLGSMLDVVEEVQLARLELRNLIQCIFCSESGVLLARNITDPSTPSVAAVLRGSQNVCRPPRRPIPEEDRRLILRIQILPGYLNFNIHCLATARYNDLSKYLTDEQKRRDSEKRRSESKLESIYVSEPQQNVKEVVMTHN
ncbi:hypothetical protein DCAR_0935632 [Daucus carota subsp. sativus]|uniref:SDA1 N-terminal domain-containing protein n=1 Tax=Daucus carota subsp. sativus TaxID=79200 RepID=A0A175YIN7_DAUCS|nr:hypothetical protein DCAR_0935632 [Daucus carota subsp. sativus]